MKTMGDVARGLGEVLAQSRLQHDQRLQTLATEGVPLDGPASSMLASRQTSRSYVSQIVPSDLSAEQYLHLTTASEEEQAERRLELCMSCPPRGGACASKEHEGTGPIWHEGLVWSTCSKWRVYRIDHLMEQSGYPTKLIPKGAAGFSAATEELQSALDVCLAYVDDYPTLPRGMGLHLSGDSGVGKTHLVVGVARELHARNLIHTSRFWENAFLLFKLRQHNEAADLIMEEATQVDLLVLDDLNVLKATAWAAEQISLIINHRWSQSLPMLLTTNDDLAEQKAILGERTVSRLVDSVIGKEILGMDYRTSKK